MTGAEHPKSEVARFPVIRPEMSELAGLVAVLRRLSTSRTLPEVMEVVTHATRDLLHADGITFVLRDGDRCYYAEEDAISPLWKGKRFPMDACISGWCMIEGKAAVIPDIYADARIPHDAYRPTFVRSLAMVPVRQDDPVAALGAYWAQSREIMPAELEILQAIANAAALALSHVEVRQSRNAARAVRSAAGRAQKGVGRSVAWIGTALSSPDREGSTPGSSVPAALAKGWPFPYVKSHSLAAWTVAVVSILLATLLRLALGQWFGADVVAFATYFPAILITTLVAGAWSGMLALALGGLFAWWAFISPSFSFEPLNPSQAVSLALYGISSVLIVWVAESHRRAFRHLGEEQGRRTLLVRELQHRMRNTLAVVQAIVHQSLRSSPDDARKISGRIAALAASNDLLGELDAQTADLKSILASELEPYATAHVELRGEPIDLAPDLARAFALAVHELATNAAKYGALSVASGHLTVSWSVTDGHVRVTWSEASGPPVAPPTRRGFGTSFIDRVMSGAGSTVAIDFRPEGLLCEIVLALSGVGRSTDR
jgi:two-component sensor histidine kinase